MATADRDLLFGLLALQNGLIDQGQLVAAFQAWTRDKGAGLADHLVARGDLDADARAGVDAIVALHVKKHGDVEKSLAAVPAGKSTRARLAALADPALDATLAHAGSGPAPGEGERESDRTGTYQVGSATSDGQRFLVLRPHARGGLGAVFVALDSELNREVALKQILDGHADDPNSRQRFVMEAEITGGLEHPGIVPVYGLGTYKDGRPYYAMRFIRGDSLKEAIERFHAEARASRDAGRRSLGLRKLLRRFLDVCNAIEYAHSRGVLHRDIKPGNVIVGKHGETLVVDWGLAKPLGWADPRADERALVPSSSSGSAETLPGSALGTPGYMSPEQAGGDLDRLGPRSDVYSLGATLYCVLTGKAPFEGDDVGEVLRKVQKGEFPRPRQVAAKVDRAIEAVCLKAMATSPEDRYPSCRALAEDVERWIADEPVSAYREPLATRATRWGRRHRTAAVSVGLLLVTAVVALSAGAFLINRERSKAEANFRRARAAVDRYFTTVSESRLLNVPGLQPLRKELLDAAEEYYRDFLRERGDDPSVRADAASASFRVGWISAQIGRPDEALGPLRTATALYRQLARDRPEVAEYRRLEAMGHGALGLILAGLGQIDEALRAHREALALREGLARDEPADVVARSDVSRSHRNIGDVHRQVGKVDEALSEWGQALAIGQALLLSPMPARDDRVSLTGRSNPSAIVREDLAGLQLDRASVLRERGRKDEAGAALREARELFDELLRERPDDLAIRARRGGLDADEARLLLDRGRFEEAARSYRAGATIYEGLVAANPKVTNFRFALAEIETQLSWPLGQLGREAEAESHLRRGIELAEGLLAEDPGSASYQGQLAYALTQTGNLLLKQGRAPEAVPLLRRGLEIQDRIARDQPRSVRHRGALGTALRGVGRAESAAGHPAAARDAFDRAREIDATLAETYPLVRYNLACDLALMIPVSEPDRREALERDAIAALRQAIADGYANLASLQGDADLDALRPRPEFQSLLTSAQSKTAMGK
jgi:serine/threonine-protein kinase